MAFRTAVWLSNDFLAIDRKGIGPGRAIRTQMRLESPSRRRHNYNLDFHQKNVTRIEQALKFAGYVAGTADEEETVPVDKKENPETE